MVLTPIRRPEPIASLPRIHQSCARVAPFGTHDVRRSAAASRSVLQLRRNLGCEIGRLPLDALAEGKADEALDSDRRPGSLAGLLNHFRDLGLLIDDKDLLEQHELLVELPQAPLDHPLDHRIGFAACLRLLAEHAALAVERRWWHRSDIEIERVRRGYMHG